MEELDAIEAPLDEMTNDIDSLSTSLQDTVVSIPGESQDDIAAWASQWKPIPKTTQENDEKVLKFLKFHEFGKSEIPKEASFDEAYSYLKKHDAVPLVMEETKYISLKWDLPYPSPKILQEFMQAITNEIQSLGLSRNFNITNVRPGSIEVILAIAGSIPVLGLAVGAYIGVTMIKRYRQVRSAQKKPGIIAAAELNVEPDVAHKREFIRILSIDGGGSRGIVSLKMLEKLEKTLRRENKTRRLADYFDAFVGSSTGSIIALALQRRKSVAEVTCIYKDIMKEVFSKGIFGLIRGLGNKAASSSWYSGSILERMTSEKIISSKMHAIGDSLLAISTYVDSSTIFMTNKDVKWDIHVGEAVRMSTAIPKLFDSVTIGPRVYTASEEACNPTKLFLEKAKLWDNGNVFVVSVGSGYVADNTDFMAKAHDIASEVQRQRNTTKGKYYRFQMPLPAKYPIDESVSELENLAVPKKFCDESMSSIVTGLTAVTF